MGGEGGLEAPQAVLHHQVLVVGVEKGHGGVRHGNESARGNVLLGHSEPSPRLVPGHPHQPTQPGIVGVLLLQLQVLLLLLQSFTIHFLLKLGIGLTENCPELHENAVITQVTFETLRNSNAKQNLMKRGWSLHTNTFLNLILVFSSREESSNDLLDLARFSRAWL